MNRFFFSGKVIETPILQSLGEGKCICRLKVNIEKNEEAKNNRPNIMIIETYGKKAQKTYEEIGKNNEIFGQGSVYIVTGAKQPYICVSASEIRLLQQNIEPATEQNSQKQTATTNNKAPETATAPTPAEQRGITNTSPIPAPKPMGYNSTPANPNGASRQPSTPPQQNFGGQRMGTSERYTTNPPRQNSKPGNDFEPFFPSDEEIPF